MSITVHPATGRVVRQVVAMDSGSPVRWPWPFWGPGLGAGDHAPARRAGIGSMILYIFLLIALSNIFYNCGNKTPAVSAVRQEESRYQWASAA
jgi:hypothetical protein